ncbi:MAG: type II toxin-antitoxin system RelE/ParE family toxin [Hungatella hathewayi]|nr:type II toxin-antitoxin system RelE/ParE family toxin [Hungatella hathewayi]
MAYSLLETREAFHDLDVMAAYMVEKFKNSDAAIRFLNQYDEAISTLKLFPFGYRGISFEYRGYEIKLKPFGTYNIFFIVNMNEGQVIILRVLKDN